VPDHEALTQILRSARPQSGSAPSLEKRLAIASILAATGAGAERQRPRLGRLEVQSRIGGGAMGVVYRAYDPQLERLVAVKLVRSWTRPEERQRMVEEARRLAQLNHPNVVAIHDIVNDEDGLYFTMEYVAGTTLRGWIEAHGDADYRDVLEWFVQAGRGLAAAHAAGMVHRDFKPDNVLVGRDGRVRVADFGLAHVLHGRDEPEQAGTPYYMAPEVEHFAPASPASDQYSFCIALRDALAGRDAPAELLRHVQRGLCSEPGDRHPSLAALVEALTEATGGKAEEGPRALLLERVERLWLRGVLDRALRDGSAAELKLACVPEHVRPPWYSWGGRGIPALGRPDALVPKWASSRELAHLLTEAQGSLLLLGPPGAGKTTLLLQLCRELWRSASLSPQAAAPAVLSLSTYRPGPGGQHDDEGNAGSHFRSWVIDELVTKYGLPRPTIERWLDATAIALLLDGLDETDAQLRAQVVAAINAFRRAYGVTLVVSCRDSEYEVLQQPLRFGAAYEIQPLDDAAMATLLEERRAFRLLDSLSRDPESRELLRNPLFLSLYASAGEDPNAAAGADRGVPGRPGWTHAYERYVKVGLAHIDAGERSALERQLGWLARAMQRQSTSDFWLERLHFGWLEAPWQARTGYALGALLVGVFAVGLNLLQVPLTGYPMASAWVFGLSVWISSFAYTRGRIKPVDHLRWSGKRALRLLPITTVIALTIGLIEALKVNFTSTMLGAGITGGAMGVLFALEPGERATRVDPNAGVHRSLQNALRLSLLSALPMGLAFGLVIRPRILQPLSVEPEFGSDGNLIVGVAIGLFVFTAVFLIYGGFTTLMHYALRLWLSWLTPLPLNLVATLDRATELGLMRRIGGGYVFLHRTLLEYFAQSGTQDRHRHGSSPPP